MKLKPSLLFQVRECLPTVWHAAQAGREPDLGPVRPAALDSLSWASLKVQGLVNGCGPTSLPDFVPDLTPAISAAGYLHDLAYLVGGTEADRQRADEAFAYRGAPGVYVQAVRAEGGNFFTSRDQPLTHGELCLIIQAGFLIHGYAALTAALPSAAVLTAIERLAGIKD